MEQAQVANVQTGNGQVEQKQTENKSVETANQDQRFSQSDLDLTVTKALKTAEAKWEKRTLEKENDWQKLYENEKAEKQSILDAKAKDDFIIKHNLSDFADIFQVLPVESLDGMKKVLDKSLKSQVEKMVNERLNVPSPVSSNATNAPVNIINDRQAYEAMRKKMHIQ